MIITRETREQVRERFNAKLGAPPEQAGFTMAVALVLHQVVDMAVRDVLTDDGGPPNVGMDRVLALVGMMSNTAAEFEEQDHDQAVVLHAKMLGLLTNHAAEQLAEAEGATGT
jgi:hypothetical protein